MVRGTVEETLNAMLDAEADRLCGAGRYERSQAQVTRLATFGRRCDNAGCPSQIAEYSLKEALAPMHIAQKCHIAAQKWTVSPRNTNIAIASERPVPT